MAKIRQHSQVTFVPQVLGQQDTNAGIPYIVPFSEPRFERKVPVHLMPTSFQTQQPGLTAGIEGISWMKVWEPPFFPTKYRVEQQQTSFWNPKPPVDLSLLQGIPWWYPFDQPKQVKVPVERQQTEMRLLLSPQAISFIQGMAWQVPFSEPYFKKETKVYVQQSQMYVGVPPQLISLIQGMAWYRPFDQPEQRKVPLRFQQFFMATLIDLRGRPTKAKGYIIGPA